MKAETAGAQPEPRAKAVDTKAAKRAIKISVHVHDRTQLETVFDYYLKRGQSLAAKRQDAATLCYQVDAYLFYPRQFALDQDTYPKERFFADLRPLLRFREPKFGYKLLLGTKAGPVAKAAAGVKISKNSPLVYLDAYISQLEQGEATEPVHNAIDEVRLFACAYISAFLRGIDRHKRRLARLLQGEARRQRPLGSPEAVLVEAEKLCGRMRRQVERAQTTIDSYRLLLARAAALGGDTAAALTGELRLIDEYCYYRLRDGVAFLLTVAQAAQTLNLQSVAAGVAVAGAAEGSAPSAIHALRNRLGELLQASDQHAVRQGYMLLTPMSSEAQKERYLHRRGELKRRIWQVLFLNLRTVSLFRFERQLAAMIAAGAASIWALGVQFMLVHKAIEVKNARDLIGISGLLFLLLGTMAYVIKDRIKDLGRSYFGGFLRHLPDHSERLFYHNREGRQVKVGTLQETARFYQPEALPERVRQLRAEVTAGEDLGDGLNGTAVTSVLQYRKVIRLSRSLRLLNRYPLRAVHDILRLNIAACLPRLAEPSRLMDIATSEGLVEAVRLPKVYYLDLVLGHSRLDKKRQAEEQSLEYFRLVLDKNGLLRVERLS